jgi:ribosomal protein S18 acetylase RimI-like enzyme
MPFDNHVTRLPVSQDNTVNLLSAESIPAFRLLRLQVQRATASENRHFLVITPKCQLHQRVTNGAVILGMQSAERLIAASLFWITSKPQQNHNFPLAHVGGVMVHPDYTGQKLGSKLLEESEKLAIERGATAIELRRALENIPALCLFKRFGFVSKGMVSRADGRVRDVMWKDLVRVPASVSPAMI